MVNTRVEEAVSVLKDARALIARPWGWVRGAYQKPTRAGTGYCALGAMNRAMSMMPLSVRGYALDCLHKALDETTGIEWSSVAEFNDESPDKRRVLRLFDKAIAIAEGEK